MNFKSSTTPLGTISGEICGCALTSTTFQNLWAVIGLSCVLHRNMSISWKAYLINTIMAYWLVSEFTVPFSIAGQLECSYDASPNETTPVRLARIFHCTVLSWMSTALFASVLHFKIVYNGKLLKPYTECFSQIETTKSNNKNRGSIDKETNIIQEGRNTFVWNSTWKYLLFPVKEYQ